MKIQINGEQADIPAGTTVSSLLEIRKVKMPEMVSVERNGSIVERKQFGATLLAENDKIEFLYFMGGGAVAGLR